MPQGVDDAKRSAHGEHPVVGIPPFHRHQRLACHLDGPTERLEEILGTHVVGATGARNRSGAHGEVPRSVDQLGPLVAASGQCVTEHLAQSDTMRVDASYGTAVTYRDVPESRVGRMPMPSTCIATRHRSSSAIG